MKRDVTPIMRPGVVAVLGASATRTTQGNQVIGNLIGAGFEGRITFDATKPDGTMRKLMDVSRLADMGWRSSISLENGIAETYQWFLANVANLREI